MEKPNILFVMTDQQRADTISALGNKLIATPNMDRLVKRGIAFTEAYSPCPVCIPARYIIRTGREPYNTGYYTNGMPVTADGLPSKTEERCGKYLARTLSALGYRTFGVGKFHTHPLWNEDTGFETQLYCEELYESPQHRKADGYAGFIAAEHPEFDFLEQLHGERTDMYYMPQMSPLPAELTGESWVADNAVRLLALDDGRPYFGFISFIAPHPPLAPPIPYNRMYNPDMMPEPVKGNLAIDHMDDQIPNMNYMIWADDINDSHARSLKARYYAELTYVDRCIGKVLDAVEARKDADNTLICFISDHGDHLGDHHGWQKESFFEASAHIPFLVSWPAKLPENIIRDELVALTDLFGIATSAAGMPELRDGIDVLGMLEGQSGKREYLYGYYGIPGTSDFKVMVRGRDWKYIYMANGGQEQLFNVTEDPDELIQMIDKRPDIADRMREASIIGVKHPGTMMALENGKLKKFPFERKPYKRIHQFDISKGIYDFLIKGEKDGRQT